MRKKGEKNSFWPSYVDIVTTLFAIMVVLFAVSYSRFRVQESELRKLADKYEEIKSIYEMVAKIDTSYFEFNREYVKHIFKIQVKYQSKEFSLRKLEADRYNRSEADSLRNRIIEAGRVIKATIDSLKQSKSAKQDIKYLVVIEGQASRIPFNDSEWENNNTLSYLRALHLHQFWKDEAQIDFSNMDKCELVISGSGEEGVPRDSTNEANNQRFLIHIVPVIGNIRMEDTQKSVVSR